MMASHAACVCLMLVAVFVPGLDARYTVNSVEHPDCSGTYYSMEGTTINPTRGDSAADCTGYVNYDTEGSSPEVRRICSDDGLEFTREMAQRLCYTLGTNMYRPFTFISGSTDQVMLYICDVYRGPGVDYPDDGDTSLVAGIAGLPGPIRGPFCRTPNTGVSNDFCMDECYSTPAKVVDDTLTEDECHDGLGHPWWATTGIDHDECMKGVLDECRDWSPDSCTPTPACGDNTECENTVGGWECECKDGYDPINDEVYGPYEYGCEDRDECEDDDDDDDDDEGICGYDAKCINTPGSYVCVCMWPRLYHEDDGTCTKLECPALPILPYAVAIVTVPQYPVYEDTVTYTCIRGYRVLEYGMPQTLYPYYSYLSQTSFEIKCSSSGQWSPYPIPICVPIKCKDPGSVPNAHLPSGSNWDYEAEVTYTCQEGYRSKDKSSGSTYFKMTCGEDGSWSEGSTCEDVDECEEQPGICGNVAKYCINTIGSHLCSCVPWYQKDPLNNQCFDWTDEIPSLQPCDLMENMGLCQNGDCYMDNGKASCSCDADYEGAACDRPKQTTTFIIAVFALVCVLILMVLLCMCCCYMLRRGPHTQPHLSRGPPMVQPTYGGYGTPAGVPHVRYTGRKGMF